MNTTTSVPAAADKLAHLAPDLSRGTARALGIAVGDLIEVYVTAAPSGTLFGNYPDVPGGRVVTGTVGRDADAHRWLHVRTTDGVTVTLGAPATKIRARKVGAAA